VNRDRQKARTRRDLVTAALQLMTAGRTPSVTEVADAAGVSRRTAYRYFPSADQLIVDALLEDLRPDVEHEISGGSATADVTVRVERLVRAMHDLTMNNEVLLRQMIRFTVERSTREPGLPPRPSRRLDYIELAVSGLRSEITAANYDQLVQALATVLGIEATLVLRDICGLSDTQLLRTQMWAAKALVDAARRA
jgi:AcrR family transcriptional regulator